MLVLVTGSNGMLGYDVVRALANNKIPHLALTREYLDIGDELSIYRVLKNNKVDILINCAAWSDVAACESNYPKAKKENGDNVGLLAKACKAHGVRLIHFSSDYIFDGLKDSPYTETDVVNPLNCYGMSKLHGDCLIEQSGVDYKIFRVQWLYGVGGHNFIAKVFDSYKQRGTSTVVDDQIGSPTSTTFVATQVMHAVLSWEKLPSGTYNLCHDDHCSWYDFASQVFKLMGMENAVKPIGSDQFKTSVRRPKKAVLSNKLLLNNLGIHSFGSWIYGLSSFLNSHPDFIAYLRDAIEKGSNVINQAEYVVNKNLEHGDFR